MQNLHWDYAESFSGREAAFLIAGFDPSSSGVEDAYRVQPVIKRLKKSYYLACAELIRVTPEPDLICDYWFWLNKFRHHKEYLLSIEIEEILLNYAKSEFVTKGGVEKLDAIEEECISPRPRHQRMEELQKRLLAIQGEWSSKMELVAPDLFLKYMQAIAEYCPAELIGSGGKPTNRTLEILIAKVPEIQRLNRKLNQRARDENISLANDYDAVVSEISALEREDGEWCVDVYSRRNVLRDELFPLFEVAKAEGAKWRDDYLHEFDEQRFSRNQLQRWIIENEFTSAYKFVSRKDSPPATEPLSDTERNSLLAIVIGMAIKGYGHDPSALRSSTAKEIEGDLKRIGLYVTDDTIRKYLKMASANVLPKEWKSTE